MFPSQISPGLGQIYNRRMFKGIFLFLLYVLLYNLKMWFPDMLPGFVFLGAGSAFVLGLLILSDAFTDACVAGGKRHLVYAYARNTLFWVVAGVLLIEHVGLDLIRYADITNVWLRNVIAITSLRGARVPTGSMEPVIMPRDKILIDMSAYQQSEPQRGDIIVFVSSAHGTGSLGRELVKRVVGLPGETIEIKGGHIFVDSHKVSMPEAFNRINYTNSGVYGVRGYRVRIPSDAYFVLGDNSASSFDSRYWGFINRKDIIGKVFKIYYPLSRSRRIDD
jgi:signal peptidase I